jgi:hypothetical protein
MAAAKRLVKKAGASPACRQAGPALRRIGERVGLECGGLPPLSRALPSAKRLCANSFGIHEKRGIGVSVRSKQRPYAVLLGRGACGRFCGVAVHYPVKYFPVYVRWIKPSLC